MRRAVALAVSRRQGHMHPRLQLGVVVAQRADPELRPRQVAQYRDLAANALGGTADRLDRARLLVRSGVGEVEPEDVGAGADQLLEHARLPARRPDGGDDLRAAAQVAPRLSGRICLHGTTVEGAARDSVQAW